MNNYNPQNNDQSRDDYVEQIVQVNRVSKKTKGGNKIGFSVLMVVGDSRGKVGVGLGKAPDVASAIRKGSLLAKKHFVDVPIINGTIPLEVRIKLGAARLMLKPAPQGSGVIAGGAVRSVVTAAGIHNISSKVLGTDNQASNVYGTIEALKVIANQYKKVKRTRPRTNKKKEENGTK